MSEIKSNKSLDYIDFASVVSAISVVLLHTNGCFWQFSDTERYWKTANVIECFFYFAVPVFFMISGATLLDFYKRYGLREYLFKRIRKSVIPYVAWSILGLLFQIVYLQQININDVGKKYIVNGLLSGQLVGVYWFFIPLFCIYLSIPLFAAVSEDKRKGLFTYLAAVCFIINVFIPFILNISSIKITFPISINVGSEYLLFVILGYLLSRYDLERNLRYIIYVLAVIGLLMHIIGTYELSMGAGQIVGTYKGYLNIPSTLYSVGVFVFFKYCGRSLMHNIFINRLVNILKKYTLGIYLIHWYILQIIIKEFSVDIKSIIFRLGAPIIIIVIAIILIWSVRKIPIVRNILP